MQLKYVWCFYAYMMTYKYVECEIVVREWLCKVDDASLVFLTWYDYDMLVSLMKGCDERKFSSLIMFIQGVNLLWPIIILMINDNIKAIKKGL